MKAGQTFALAGLVQERTETLNRGLPYLSDLPVLGVPFRRTRDEVNEIELLDPGDAGIRRRDGPVRSAVRRTRLCHDVADQPRPVLRRPRRSAGALQSDPRPDGVRQDPCDCAAATTAAADVQLRSQTAEHGAVITDGMNMPGGVGYDERLATARRMVDRSDASGTGADASDSGRTEHADSGQSSPRDAGRSADCRPSRRRRRRPPSRPSGAGIIAARRLRYSLLSAGGPGRLSRNTRLRGPTARSASRFSCVMHPVRITRSQQAGQPRVRSRENGLIGPVGYDVQ